MADSTTPSPDFETENYEVMVEQIDAAVDQIVEKIEDGRIRKPEHEKVRVQYYRALGYLIRSKRQVLEDKALEEFADRIEALEDRERVLTNGGEGRGRP